MDRKIKLFSGQRREPETFEPLSRAHAAYLRELQSGRHCTLCGEPRKWGGEPENCGLCDGWLPG